jgi:CheY-like chemotaxis protein
VYKVEHILVAEDDPSDAFFLQRAFKRTGIAVELDFVEDGQEAIEYLRDLETVAERATSPLPKLLLLDLKMPRRDGFDVLDWVRKQPYLKSLFVVIFSSSEQVRDIDRAYELGANSYLVKPHSIQDLMDLVASFKKHWMEVGEPGGIASQAFGD